MSKAKIFMISSIAIIFTILCIFFAIVLSYQSAVNFINEIEANQNLIESNQNERITELESLVANNEQLIAYYQRELADIHTEMTNTNDELNQQLDAMRADLRWERHLRILDASDFAADLTVDDGFGLKQTFSTSTASFDLVMYRFTLLEAENAMDFTFQVGNDYWEVVILQNGMMQDVIRHYPQPIGRMMINPAEMLSIIEVDVDFDGQPDLLIWLGAFGNQGAGRYDAFLQREDGFLHAPSFAQIMNPMVNHETRLISASWRASAAWHGMETHRFIEDDFVMISVLSRRGYARFLRYEEERLINGEWQINSLCIIDEGVEIDTEYLEICAREENENLYHRIYDPAGYWHFSNRGLGLWELLRE